MYNNKFRALLISDFNINNFSAYLHNNEDSPIVETCTGPFGQVMEILLDENNNIWKKELDFAIIWTQPESIIKSFDDIINFKQLPYDQVLAEVDEYANVIKIIGDRIKFAFVPTWLSPLAQRGYGLLDMRSDLGIANILMQMNLRLAENLKDASNIYLLNAQKWIEMVGNKAFNPKLWYMAKVPFGNRVFQEATRDVKAALRGISGGSKKLIIIDLDDTIWGGTVGDVGWENIQLGGHDPLGEAFVDFQKALKSFTNRGVLLGIVSKNNEFIALEAFQKHPEMVLKIEDFAGWKINWGDKAQNIIDLVLELNLGIESVVFIDDNPFERARIREALPEVLVPEMLEDKTSYRSTLLSLTCFDSPSISDEDKKRSQMYVAERQRETLRKNIGSLDSWLLTLDIKVEVDEVNAANIQRTIQLLNKTNQLNLSTRRMTEVELLDWLAHESHKLWTFRVSDRFGESGLTGIASLDVQGNIGKIVDFVLSCRVIGRHIEETMVYTIYKYAQSINLDELHAVYIPTSKNQPCLEFWDRSGFVCHEGNVYKWKMKDEYKYPDFINIVNNCESYLLAQ